MTKTKILGAGFVLLLLVTGLIFTAPLCFTTSCTPAERQVIESEWGASMAPAEACALRQLALGEASVSILTGLENDAVDILARCSGLTAEGLARVAANLLADELGLDAQTAPPVDPDAGTPARKRARRVHAQAKALVAKDASHE